MAIPSAGFVKCIVRFFEPNGCLDNTRSAIHRCDRLRRRTRRLLQLNGWQVLRQVGLCFSKKPADAVGRLITLKKDIVCKI